MQKIKRSVCVFFGAVEAEIQRFKDFIDQEDEKWRLDPVATEARWNEAFRRFHILAAAAFFLVLVFNIISF